MINDYEQRFQRSLQKLPIPSWFTADPNASSSRYSSKQSIVSNSAMTGTTYQPRSYRSCRSSLATSPSPSIHSWHPNNLTDRMTLTHRHLNSSCRRHQKYEKGIERVSKSSRWYQPKTFDLSQTTLNKVTETTNNFNQVRTRSPTYAHYDIPNNAPSTPIELINIQSNSNVIRNQKANIPLSPRNQIKTTLISMHQQIPSLESIHLAVQHDNKILVEDTNSGVREIFDDENVLRELDENEINDTDEFFVFAPDINDQRSLSTTNRLYAFAKFSDQSNENSRKNNQHTSGVNLRLPDDRLNHQQESRPIDQSEDNMNDSLSTQLAIHQSFDGVNEETVRIGRLLLKSIPYSSKEDKQFQWTDPPRILDQLQTHLIDNDEEVFEDIQHDSGYSSNHEKFPVPLTVYERLFDCYSYVTTDLMTANLSSITDEAYESEPTTVSSSIGTTAAYVHPDLEHEFEYPTPPPPIPDRRLKPVHFRTSTANKHETVDPAGYSFVQKTKSASKTAIQHLIGNISNNISSTPVKPLSSRQFCGSIPVSREIYSTRTSSPAMCKTRPTKEKRTGKTLNCLNSTADNDDHDKCSTWIKSSPSTKTKTKKHSKKEFDEATNGLAIRLLAPMTNGNNSTWKSTKEKLPNSTLTKRIENTKKNCSITDEFKSTVRLPVYETSV